MESADRRITTEEWLYLCCYGVWLFLCCLYFSEWRKLYPIASARIAVSYSAYVLLVIGFAANRKKLSARQFALALAFLTVAVLSEIMSQTRMIGATAAFIIAARNIDKKRILRVSCGVMLTAFVLVVASMLAGFLPNLTEVDAVRQRFRIGFIYTSYPSHLVLFMTLILIALSEKLTLIRTILLAAANFAIYLVTDTVTDLAVALFAILMAFLFSYFRQRELMQRCGPVFIAMPVGFLLLSYLSQYFYDETNAAWVAADRFVHSRLNLGHAMMLEKQHTLFGQYIKWVGATTKSKLPYNFVDNDYLHTGLNQGILYLGFLILIYTFAMVCFAKKASPLFAIALMGILIHGLVDPQMSDLTWHPFLLFGCMLFEEAKEEKNVIPIRPKVYLQ